jgi:hypothetical protein
MSGERDKDSNFKNFMGKKNSKNTSSQTVNGKYL